MRLTSLQIKRFFNNKLFIVLLSIILLVFFVMVMFPILNYEFSSPFDVLSASLNFNYLYAVCFMFLSYEFLIKSKTNNCFEFLGSLKNAKFKYYISGISVLLLLLFVFCVVIFLTNTIFYISCSPVNTKYINHLFLNILLNTYLISAVFILFGGIFTFFNKRTSGYASMIIVCLFTSPIFNILGTQLHSNLNLNIFPLIDLLDFSVPLVDWTPIYSFGFSVLPYRFQQIGFFIFLLIGLIVLKTINISKIKTIAISFLSISLSLIFLLMYMQPASKVTLGNNPFNGFASDQYYYNLEDTVTKEEKANFSVNKYNLTFTFDRELSATAELYLTDVSSHELIFTLYHGYSVLTVFDENNNKLNYERISDYITIFCENAPQKITIKYSGNGNRFFSNTQGVSLPGYFPFYPQPGFKTLYNSQEMGFDKYMNEERALFEVSINSPQQIFCNLPETGFNSFSGEADSLTLISGFYETIYVNDIQIIYPYLFLTKSYPKETMISDIESFISEHKELDKIEKFIVLANINNTSSYERMTIYDNYITCTGLIGLPEQFNEQLLNSEQKVLKNCMDLYKNVQPAYQQLLNSAEQNPEDKNSKIVLLFDQKLKLSEELFLKDVEEFLSKNNTMSTIEFLNTWEANINA